MNLPSWVCVSSPCPAWSIQLFVYRKVIEAECVLQGMCHSDSRWASPDDYSIDSSLSKSHAETMAEVKCNLRMRRGNKDKEIKK